MNTSPIQWLSLGVCLALAACGDSSDCKSISGCQELLAKRASAEEAALTRASGSPRDMAIIGDGVGGIAAATNLPPTVRVYGDTSFWLRLNDLPAVWQTTLSGSYADAGLPVPGNPVVGQRIPRDSVILANLRGLVRSGAAYLARGRVIVTPGANGDWTITDSKGRSESIAGPIIVSTGVSRPVTITEMVKKPFKQAADSARLELLKAGRLRTGDLCVANAPVANIVGILGAGGSAADCVVAVIAKGATQVVVWGNVDPNLPYSDAFNDLVTKYSTKICLINGLANTLSLQPGANQGSATIVVNGFASPQCENPASRHLAAGKVDQLVESLGRLVSEPPLVVTTAAAKSRIKYTPVLEPNTCALIAVSVTFLRPDSTPLEDRPPMYLIGAAATWIPDSVVIGPVDRMLFSGGLNITTAMVNRINVTNSKLGQTAENPPQGFGVAAYMGSHFARHWSAKMPMAKCQQP
jgi:hypothetical protein